jgi:hypothetical protein
MKRTYESAVPRARRRVVLIPYRSSGRRLHNSCSSCALGVFVPRPCRDHAEVLDVVVPPNGKPGRYRPDGKLLAFLNSL